MGRSTLVILAALAAWLAAGPQTAQASFDLGVSQSVSAHVVKPGQTVTIEATVENRGTEATSEFGEAIIELGSLGGFGEPANDPYQSFSSSQGSCFKEAIDPYQGVICQLGRLEAGASAHVRAMVQVNQTMNHNATLLPNIHEGGYQDADNTNNQATDRITLDVPPVVTGSSRVRLPVLPQSCVNGDFPLKVIAKAPGVKKVTAVLELGADAEGYVHEWRRTSRGSRLSATVPASRIVDRRLGVIHKLQIKARRGGAGPLKRTVEFQFC